MPAVLTKKPLQSGEAARFDVVNDLDNKESPNEVKTSRDKTHEAE
jgi:hypothetical protein